jgi:hypothetical protein
VKDEETRRELEAERKKLQEKIDSAQANIHELASKHGVERQQLEQRVVKLEESTKSFSRSCRNIRVEDAVSKADCLRSDGSTYLSSYLPLDHVLANIDGKFGRGGGFSRTALNITLKRNILVARLQRLGGKWSWDEVNLDDFVQNVDGVLVADMTGFRNYIQF